jgi:hypothetical protein
MVTIHNLRSRWWISANGNKRTFHHLAPALLKQWLGVFMGMGLSPKLAVNVLVFAWPFQYETN